MVLQKLCHLCGTVAIERRKKYCDKCRVIINKEKRKQYYIKNKYRIIKTNIEYNKNNPIKRKEIWDRYFNKNKDIILEKVNKYRKNNPEKVKNNLKRYKQSKKGKFAESRYRKSENRKNVLKRYNKSPKGIISCRLKVHRYNSNKKKVEEIYKFTRKDIDKIFNLFDNKCFNCGSKKDLEIDHFYPLVKNFGLSHRKFNICILCRSCNGKKKDKMPEDFFSKDKINEFENIRRIFINKILKV